LADLNERSHRNSELFRGLREWRSTEDDLKMRWENIKLFLREPLGERLALLVRRQVDIHW